MATEKERGQERQRSENRPPQSVSASESDVIPNRNLHQQGTPDRLPAGSEMNGASDDQTSVEDQGAAPKRPSERPNMEEHRKGRRHENRENPLSDHPTGHLGYDRKNLKDVIRPDDEGFEER